MIYSMTGYARSSDQGEWGNLVWEVRSVNHRILDCNFKMPDNFRHLEMDLREIVRKKLHRGKIDCFLQYKSGTACGLKMSLNVPLVNEMKKVIEELSNYMPSAKSVNPLQILSWPEILQTETQNMQPVYDIVLQLFDKTLQDLISVRAREGKALRVFATTRLQDIKKITTKVRPKIPEIIAQQRAKIVLRLAEIKEEIEINISRIDQEMVFYAQKIDIAEELDRLDTHVNESIRVLENGGQVGKRLDFLLQELNREANTMAAKSVDTEITSLAVELKVLIEQIREQVQNLE